ncbi:MAG: NADH:ubiquinone reductase (Na(+)-transporting) subunit B [Bacteroidales bacterium]|jgi:Na+-transporting NADH:ubiquinone oxidoreductase subunit B|nr:NADH:ubiquinone reductase (Na(+)-transporting) subunit B [Bacteroidales bacterium]
MNFLLKQIKKVKPHFEKGGRFEKLRSVFDGFETFIFVPEKVTSKGSHIRDYMDMKRTMTVVILALLPALLFGSYNIGLQHTRAFGIEGWSLMQMFWFGFLKILPLIIVSYGVGLGIEFVVAQLRGHEINEGYLVTGMLIPLIMPIDVPLWMVAVSVAFAVIIGKEIFGGTGMNILNPALTARAFLFFSYPGWMTGDSVWIEGLTKGTAVDGFSGATPLALAKLDEFDRMPSVTDMIIGTIPGSVGETSVIAILIGALILIATGVGSWRIMLSMTLGALGMGLLLNISGSSEYSQLPAYYHLIMGGFAFGAVFMATDPVTAAQTNTGKWIYGALTGIMVVIIRVFNPAYPEGTMLAILLMNVFAPLIDHFVVNANINRRLKRVKTT